MSDGGIQWWQQAGQYRAVADRPLMQRKPKMKIDDMLPSKYLKTSDLADGDRVVTIKELKKTNVARQDETAEYKFVAYFYEFDKGMVLNATNIKRLAKYLGDDTDDWIGNPVTLYVDDNVQYGSDIVSGLRFKSAGKPGAKKPGVDDVNRKLREAADDSEVPF